MTDKFNVSKKKTHAQPYDTKISEKCNKCSGEVVYRRKSYFGKKTYFRICNSCGWYELMDRESWNSVINKNDSADKKKQKN
ncbi:hypothetical protein KJ656_04890 [bacterium]|nr:hypothetical protein [bacterium]